MKGLGNKVLISDHSAQYYDSKIFNYAAGILPCLSLVTTFINVESESGIGIRQKGVGHSQIDQRQRCLQEPFSSGGCERPERASKERGVPLVPRQQSSSEMENELPQIPLRGQRGENSSSLCLSCTIPS